MKENNEHGAIWVEKENNNIKITKQNIDDSSFKLAHESATFSATIHTEILHIIESFVHAIRYAARTH